MSHRIEINPQSPLADEIMRAAEEARIHVGHPDESMPTNPSPMIEAGLLDRLETMIDHRGDGIPTQYLNPDGPEAAAEIVSLREQVAEARGAIEEALSWPSIRAAIDGHALECRLRAALKEGPMK